MSLHVALDHGLFLRGDVRHALVLRLVHGDTINGHAHKHSLPYLARGGRRADLREHGECYCEGVGEEAPVSGVLS